MEYQNETLDLRQSCADEDIDKYSNKHSGPEKQCLLIALGNISAVILNNQALNETTSEETSSSNTGCPADDREPV